MASNFRFWTLFILCIVASNYSQNHLIYGKYKRVQSFILHFPQNKLHVKLRTSTSDCKDVWNIPGSNFVKDFSALPSHSKWCQQHHKSVVLSTLISFEAAGKNQLEPTQSDYERCSSIVTFLLAKKSRTKKRPVRWSIVVKAKPTVGSPFFQAFPSNRIPNVT
jgi:hypothetical protein